MFGLSSVEPRISLHLQAQGSLRLTLSQVLTFTLGCQTIESKSYLCILGCKVGMICLLGALGLVGLVGLPDILGRSGEAPRASKRRKP